MTKPAKAYAGGIVALGLWAMLYSIYHYALGAAHADPYRELQSMLCLIVLCAICRSMPIFINRNYTLDVSILSIVAAVLAHGVYAAVVIYLISSVLTVDLNSSTGERRHIFNTPPIKTAFNNAATVLSILLPGLVIINMGYEPGRLVFPQVLLPMFVFTSLAFVINYAGVYGMFLISGQSNLNAAAKGLVGLLPNVLAAMPLGLFTGVLFTSEYGNWMAIVMLLPLLLARYAWKLYGDAQVQYYRLIHAFISSMEAKDKYTEGHSRRVHQYAVLIAKAMKLKQRDIETIRSAALLHDIGKIGISDAILLKPDRLTDEEFAQIKRHPDIGVDIVGRVGLPDKVIEAIHHHHERYDGRGYPEGLRHEKLSLAAEILTVADSYDAMTSERPYRQGLPREVATAQLIEGKGTQFNPELVDVFIQALADLGDDGELPDGDLS